MEKKLTTIEFRCSEEFKAQVDSLASSLDMDRSELVRAAVEAEVQRHRAMYEGLHKVFASPTDSK